MQSNVLSWLKKFGSDQNIFGPVKGQGIRLSQALCSFKYWISILSLLGSLCSSLSLLFSCRLISLFSWFMADIDLLGLLCSLISVLFRGWTFSLFSWFMKIDPLLGLQYSISILSPLGLLWSSFSLLSSLCLLSLFMAEFDLLLGLHTE